MWHYIFNETSHLSLIYLTAVNLVIKTNAWNASMILETWLINKYIPLSQEDNDKNNKADDSQGQQSRCCCQCNWKPKYLFSVWYIYEPIKRSKYKLLKKQKEVLSSAKV